MRTNWIDRIFSSQWMIVIAFVILVAPFALQYQFHYPDEMYYTNGALIMNQTGDYLTPHLANGGLRFNKPILTYWFVLAGQALFGTNPMGSRFFFLIAGAMIVWLAYRLGKTITGNHQIALLASLITASHPTVIMSATRSIPDILLCLFTTMSALGVAGLIKNGNQAAKKELWLFYLGIALAFEVKGLPALAMGGLAGLFLLFNPWQRISFKTMFHLPSLLVSVTLAASWFVAMYQIHGDMFINSFLEDQVGIRVGSAVLQALKFLVMGILFFAGLMLPWILISTQNWKERLSTIKQMTGTNKAFSMFTALWIVAILGMSALVIVFYERYLLPVVPVAAVWLALFIASHKIQPTKFTHGIQWFFIGINAVVILFGIFLSIGMGTHLMEILKMIISVGLLLFIVMKRKETSMMFSNLTLLILLVFFSGTLISRPISIPGQAEQAHEFLKNHTEIQNKTIGFYGHLSVSSRMRMGFGNNLKLVDITTPIEETDFSKYKQLIIEDKYLKQLQPLVNHTEPVTINWKDPVPIDLIIKQIAKGTYTGIPTANQEIFYLVSIK